MKVLKEDLDRIISLSREYYKTGDDDALDGLKDAERKAFGHAYWVSGLIENVTLKRSGRNEPYKTYYKVLEAVGFEIAEGGE